MNNLQFSHDQLNGVTYAVDVSFNREDLLESISYINRPIQFLIGKSYVHPNDVYCKKTGREVSSERLQPHTFKLDLIRVEGSKAFIYFITEDESLLLKFRVNSKSEKPHLLEVMKTIR